MSSCYICFVLIYKRQDQILVHAKFVIKSYDNRLISPWES